MKKYTIDPNFADSISKNKMLNFNHYFFKLM